MCNGQLFSFSDGKLCFFPNGLQVPTSSPLEIGNIPISKESSSNRHFSEAIFIFRGCSPRERIPKNDAITSKDLLHFPRPMIFGIYIMILSGYSNYSTWLITSVYPPKNEGSVWDPLLKMVHNPGGDPLSAWGGVPINNHGKSLFSPQPDRVGRV